jgi:plasmid replication initiation protein
MKKDVALKSKTPKVYKSNKLNNANFGDFTHTDYQVFLTLLSKIGGVDGSGKYLQYEKLEREHTLKASEFGRVFNCAQTHCYPALKKAVNKLMKTDIRIQEPGSTSYTRINVCSKAEYIENEGAINVKFTDDIMPYLIQVKERFMLYNLKEISNFGSIYTTRLYELLQEFKETGWMIKSIDQLKEAFAVGSKYKMYAHLKSKTFAPACEEINRNYKINLRFEEIKDGRKVSAIKFIFKPIAILEVANEATGKTRKLYTKHEITITKQKKQLSKKAKEPILIEDQKAVLVSQPEKPQNSRGFFSSILNIFRKK